MEFSHVFLGLVLQTSTLAPFASDLTREGHPSGVTDLCGAPLKFISSSCPLGTQKGHRINSVH